MLPVEVAGILVSSATIEQSGTSRKPMLGRYQVEKRELGKGVCLAWPKTQDPGPWLYQDLLWSQEFAVVMSWSMRVKGSFRPETAGRLQHRNIVTIFDAG